MMRPALTSLLVAAMLAAAPAEAAADRPQTTHKVYAGQRLQSIANRYNVSIDAIEEFAQPHFHVLVRRAYASYGARLRAPAAIGC